VVARAKLLVIDDEVRLGELMARHLEAVHDVRVCTSGREGRVALLETDYDVVLCDLMMPDLTGMDLYEEVRARRPEQLPRFVFVTGGAFTPRAAAFLERERPSVLAKPFTSEALEEAVAAKLGELGHPGRP
jgi:two-component system NtrC family sensor kinase